MQVKAAALIHAGHIRFTERYAPIPNVVSALPSAS